MEASDRTLNRPFQGMNFMLSGHHTCLPVRSHIYAALIIVIQLAANFQMPNDHAAKSDQGSKMVNAGVAGRTDPCGFAGIPEHQCACVEEIMVLYSRVRSGMYQS